MPKQRLLDRLRATRPGWGVYDEFVRLVESRDFEHRRASYGSFLVSGTRLVFSELKSDVTWPDWLPGYVPALYGMKAGDWKMSGGYAAEFCNRLAEKGSLFSPAGNDEELDYPLIDVPEGVYDFQSNSSSALFFVNTRLEVMYPNSDDECFEVLAALDDFTRENIRQVLAGREWFEAYCGSIKGTLID